MAYSKPQRPAIIVAEDKVAAFSSQRVSAESKEKRRQFMEYVRKNNEKRK